MSDRRAGHTGAVNPSGVDLAALGAQVEWADVAAAQEARAAAPAASGRLGELTAWWAGVQGHYPPHPPKRVRCAVVGGPGADTAAVAADLDVGLVALEVPDTVDEAFSAGVRAADDEVDGGTDLLVVADPDDSPAAAVLVSVLTGAEPVALLPRGAAAIDTASWIARATGLRDARRSALPVRHDANALLAALGRPSLAATVGLVLRAAARRTPLVLDGTAAVAAGLLCHDVQPRAAQWWRVADRAADPVHQAVVRELGMHPLLDLGTTSGDGIAGLLTTPLLHAAAVRAASR